MFKLFVRVNTFNFFPFFRYIYLPMQKILHYKLLASFLCFCFVCVWHGLEDYIVTWAIMNFIGITIEYFSSMLYQKKIIYISEVLGPTGMNVIKNIMAVPLLAFSAISNFYFFGGKYVGDIFLRKLFGKMTIFRKSCFIINFQKTFLTVPGFY